MDDSYVISDEEDYFDSDQEESLDEFEDDGSDAIRGASGASTAKVITKESLLAAQREDLQRVMDLLSVKEHNARTLLIHYRWNVERLIEVYVEEGKSRMFAEAGVTVVETSDHDPPEPSFMKMCDICMDDVLVKDLTRMDCGHCFCNNCWTEHFVVKINEGQSKRIQCMAHKCNSICDESIIRKLVCINHPDLAEKFDRFLLESYIEDNGMVKWCPSIPHCGNAIRLEVDEVCEVECSCGLQFCFSCSSEVHSPCSCLMWELWTKKCRDESETVNWLTVHTKSCPKCLKPVEKNGGCNLVSCICGQAFCWLCGGATGRDHTWTSIADHSCGRFKEDSEKKAETAKRHLDRYRHYYNRYKAHTDSFKEESRLKQTLGFKISYLESRDITLRDFSWLTDGLCSLFRSRRALSCSYPFAFYMFGEDLFKDEMTAEEREIKQHLFEDQQQQLESKVEKISKFFGERFENDDVERITEIRSQVINLSKIIDKLCRKMYECIENELLGSLQGSHHVSVHSIATYQSEGVYKAEELSVGLNSHDDKCHVTADNNDGEMTRNEASGSESLEEKTAHLSRKRARKSSAQGNVFDLNMPPEIHQNS